MKVAEDFFRPEIDATFAGITVGEFDYRDALRKEEEHQGDDPEPDGDAAVGCDGGNYVQVEDSDYEEEDEIAASEGADQVRLSGLGRWWTKFFTVAPRFLGGRPSGLPYMFVADECKAGGGARPTNLDLVRGQRWLTDSFLLRFRER